MTPAWLTRRAPSQRLAARLTRATMAAASLALLIAGLILNLTLFVSQRSALHDDALVQARNLAEAATAPLVFNDALAADEALGTLKASPRVLGAVLYDDHGEVFARYVRDPAADAAEPWAEPLQTELPVQYEGRTLGTLRLAVSYDGLLRRSAGFALLTGLAAVVALAAAYLLARGVRRAIDRTEAHLDELAYSDPVTGLLNRRAATEHLAALAGRHAQTGRRFGVMLLDLDDFSTINDSLGHAAGDAVLRELSVRLARALEPGQTAFRMGGDEFMVAFDGDASGQTIERLRGLARHALAQEMALEGAVVQVRGSAGIACLPDDAGDPGELLRAADMAMYRAKQNGKNGVLVYDASMAAETRARLRVESELRQALARGELRLVYQPVVDLATCTVVAAEALVRWQHPTRGLLAPAEFIGVAESSGLVVDLGQQVLRLAAQQIAAWERQRLIYFRVAVNASALQLKDGILLGQVAQALREHGASPDRLEIEITEHSVIADHDAAVGALTSLRAMGVRISIDDFGTGLSSLSYLRDLPVDKLKIDRSFVREVPGNAGDAAIVRAIVSMAKALDLRIVAEGIETEVQRDFLQGLGVDFGQGYAFGRPMAAEELVQLLHGADEAQPGAPAAALAPAPGGGGVRSRAGSRAATAAPRSRGARRSGRRGAARRRPVNAR